MQLYFFSREPWTSSTLAGFVLTQDPGVKFDVEILPLSCSQDFYDLSILTLMGINCNYIFFLSESLVVVF